MDKQLWKNIVKQKLDARALSPATLARGGATAMLALLLAQARAAFDCYPLGLGLLCALSSRVGWGALGAIAGAFAAPTGSPWARICAVALALVARVGARLWLDPPVGYRRDSRASRWRTAGLFGENLSLRMTSACVAAFFAGVWALVADGLRFRDLAGAVVGMLIAPLFCLVVAPLFGEGGADKLDKPDEGRRELALGGLIVALCFAVRETEIVGISLGAFVAFLASVGTARQRGVVRGGVMGIACGLCLGWWHGPLFGLSAVVAGLIWPKSATAAVTVGALVAMVVGGYTEGLMALVRLVPAVVCGAIFLLSADRLSLFGELVRTRPVLRDETRTRLEQSRAASAEARIEALSETFSALSGVCSRLADRLRRPSLGALRRVCDEACDAVCCDCPHRSTCWAREADATDDAWSKLAAALHRDGRADESALPPHLRERCLRLPDLLERVNDGCARLWAIDEASGPESFAVDYEAVSAILRETLAAERDDYAVDDDLTSRIRACADRLGLGARGILAYGGRRKQILADGLDLRRAGIGVDELRLAFAEVAGHALTAPVFALEGDLVSMRLGTARRYAVEVVHRAVQAADEAVCGDSVMTLESEASDAFYALVSDGMGSGREAALTAKICTTFLEKMLASGMRRETALRLLNAFVRAKGLECSATIDLMELDLLTGRAAFLKSGAAPSYVRRDGNLFKLQSKTVPIGIMRALDAEQLCFDIEPGDLVVMLSDGIAQSFEESVWLLDLLAEAHTDLPALADAILAGAERETPRPDDRSVILIAVKEA